jgi:hypothetical protein
LGVPSAVVVAGFGGDWVAVSGMGVSLFFDGCPRVPSDEEDVA